MKTMRRKLLPLLYLIVISSLVGCKTLLAPEYDKAIVETISTTSEKTMTFFAKISQGTENTNFSDRAEEYNNLIGAYDALKIKAMARPVPSNIATKKIDQLLNTRNNSLSGAYPSGNAFEEISKTLTMMKNTDQTKGIKPIAVEAFRNQIVIYLDQALTYESFLKR